MTIWLLSLPVASIPMVVNNAIRATGNTKTPGLIMAFSSTLNIILDPLFIFGIWFFPEMGIKGAAVATVIARTVSSISAVSYMHFKMKMFDLTLPSFSKVINSWKQIMTLGVPSSLSLMLMPISLAIITRITAYYGVEAVAASGAGGRIDTLTLMVIFSLASALLPFTGQNFGARKLERVRTGLKLAQYFSFLWGVFMLLAIYVFKTEISLIFTTEQVVADYIISYLTAMTVSYPAIGVSIMCANVLNGLHRPYLTALLNLFRTIIFAIPAAFIGGKIAGPQGIFIATAAVNIAASFVYYTVAVRSIKKAADRFDFEKSPPEIPADIPV
jgi:putative MATE family efflux protein